MPREVLPFEQFLEVIRKADRVELYYIAWELHESTGVNISVYETQLVKELNGLGHVLNDHKDLLRRKFLFAKGLPQSQVLRGFHFDVDKSFFQDRVVINLNNILMLNLSQEVNYSNSFSSLLFEESWDVNASDHLNQVSETIKIGKYFSVSLFKIKHFLNILIASRISHLDLRDSLLRIKGVALTLGLKTCIIGAYSLIRQ